MQSHSKKILLNHQLDCHHRKENLVVNRVWSPLDNQLDEILSTHLQEGVLIHSSVFGSCEYVLRFSEKTSPFDGDFNALMRVGYILAGFADESLCNFLKENEEKQISVLIAIDNESNQSPESDATNQSIFKIHLQIIHR